MKHKKQWITALAISALTVGGTSVWAASNTTDTAGNAPKWHHADKGRHFDQTILLKKLGITTAEAEAARTAGKTITQLAEEKGIPFADYKKAELAAAKEQLDALVESGDLTKTQAADMLERHTERFADATSYGDLPDRDMKRGMHGPGGFFGESIIPAVLKALGLDADKFEESGKSLHEFAESEGIKYATFEGALVKAQKANIDQLVKDGKITDKQATEMKAHIDEHAAEQDSYDDLQGRKGRGFGGPGRSHGSHGGHGGGGFGPGMHQDSNSDSSTDDDVATETTAI